MLTEERLGKLALLQSPEEFRLGRDALALARFASLRRHDRVCDLGCGSGVLDLLLLDIGLLLNVCFSYTLRRRSNGTWYCLIYSTTKHNLFMLCSITEGTQTEA